MSNAVAVKAVIKGKGDGNWGRVTINTDGSMLLENVTIEGVLFENCDIVAASGENPIPFADRANIADDKLAYQQETGEPQTWHVGGRKFVDGRKQ